MNTWCYEDTEICELFEIKDDSNKEEVQQGELY